MKKPKQDTIQTTELQIRQTIGANIRAARKKLWLSAKDVAIKLGISRVGLTQIENGRNNISAVMLWKLCCCLGCEIQSLFPNVPEGFALSRRDLEKIEKEGGEQAKKWAKNLWPTENL